MITAVNQPPLALQLELVWLHGGPGLSGGGMYGGNVGKGLIGGRGGWGGARGGGPGMDILQRGDQKTTVFLSQSRP